jgi:predicted ATP-grasp superfamily ATP-dependent carboligase
VTALDAFGDLDQHASVTACALSQRFTAHAAARAARNIQCDAVAYLSNFENHPGAVRTLAAGRALWGNAPDVLRRVRDPFLVSETLARRGFAVPAVCSGEPGTVNLEPWNPGTLEPGSRWLVKPFASGGGRRVRAWRPGSQIPRGCYLQELVDGTPGSVVFVAAGGRAVPLGMSWQLVGEDAFGAAGYKYCGNIFMAAGDTRGADDESLMNHACALCRVAAEEFSLVGVNGIDFVARGSIAYAIEVNPRWSASMELVERAYGLSVFSAHAGACAAGVLPEFDLAAARRGVRAVGKAVVFARRDVVVGDTRAWLSRSTGTGEPVGPALPVAPALPAHEIAEIRDVPHPGERILAGRPVCTVFARGSDGAGCHAALVQRAERVYGELARWEREIA